MHRSQMPRTLGHWCVELRGLEDQDWSAGLPGARVGAGGGGLSPHQQEAAAVVQVLDQSSIQGRTPCA